MAIEINFENNYRGVLLQASESLTGVELVKVTEQIYRFDGPGKVNYQILDMSNIEHIDIDIPTIRYIAHLDQMAAEKNGGMKIAVITKPGLIETMARAWEEFNKSTALETILCFDMATARSWIAQADLEIMA